MNKHNSRKIDLKYFGAYLKSKIKILIIIAVVGLVCGSLYSIKSGAAKSTIVNAATQSVDTARAALGQTEVDQVNSVYDTYEKLQTQLKNLRTHQKNSILFNLDANTGKGEKLIYALDNNKKINAIGDALNELIIDDNLCDKINNNLKTKLSSSTIKELINISSNSNNNLNSSDGTDIIENNNLSSKDLIIKIYAENDSQKNVITKLVKQKVNTESKKLASSTYGNFRCQLISESDSKITEKELNSFKIDSDTDMRNISASIADLLNTLTTNQRSYFESLVTANGYNNEAAVSTTNQISMKKVIFYAILSAILLLILAFIILLIIYLTSQLLRYPGEVKNLFDLRIITTVNNADQSVLHGVNEIQYLIDNTSKNIAISSSSDSNEIKQFFDSLKKDSVSNIIQSYPVTKQDFDQLKEIDELILVEKINSSNIEKIQDMVSYYVDRNINIAGVVVLL